MPLLEMVPNVTFIRSVMIGPYVKNLLTENGPTQSLRDNTDFSCQKRMDGEPLLHIYRPRSAKVILLIHQVFTFE